MTTQKKLRARILSMALSLAMVFTMLPMQAFAITGSDSTIGTSSVQDSGTPKVCESHTAHDEACNYIEAVEATLCAHLNEDNGYSCAPVLDSGSVSEDIASPSEASYACDHSDDCGYVEAIEGADCTHTCEKCTVAEQPTQSEAVKKVLVLITALPTMAELEAQDPESADFSAYLEKLRTDIANARTAYDALTAEEKETFDASVLAKLTELEDVLAGVSATTPMSSSSGTITMPWGQGFAVNQTTKAATTQIWYGGKKWLVIGAKGTGVASASGDMTLLANDNISSAVKFDDITNNYGTINSSNTAQSNLKTEIEKLTATDTGLFSAEELTAISKVTLTGGATNIAQDGMYGDKVENALLWPLDVVEANALGGDDIRKVSSSYWWLRSPGDSVNFAAVVSNLGEVYVDGDNVDYIHGVRPAFKLNLNSVLFASAEVSGKSDTAGATLSAAVQPTGAQKLTVLDNDFTAGTVTAVGADTNSTTTIKISATGATASKSLSAIITDNTGKVVKYYGKIANISATGTVTNAELTLPVTLDADNVLKIFAEEINAGNLTDYASTPVVVTPAVAGAITIKLNNNTAEINGASLSDALTGQSISSITIIEITKGKVTTADWNHITTLTSLTKLKISNQVTTVDNIPDGSSSIFPKSIKHVDIHQSITIGAFAFAGCTALEVVSLPAATAIGASAFKGCTGLLATGLSDVITIGESAFEGCIKLSTENLSKATTIGKSAFADCTELETATFYGATTIGESAFKGCLKLHTATFRNATTIGKSAFEGCVTLGVATFPKATTIGESAFSGCVKLVSTDFSKVETIESYAFKGCTKLAAASFPAVTSIKAYAFKDCTYLINIALPASPPTVEAANAFEGVEHQGPLTPVDATGTPLTGDSLSSALALYKSDTTDGPDVDSVWYGWVLEDNPPTGVIITFEGKNVSYNGEVQTHENATITEAASGGTMTYSYTTSDGTLENGKPKGAGSYTVTATYVKGDITEDATVVLIIRKLPLTIKAEDKTMYYSHDLPTLTVKYTGFITGEDESDLTGTAYTAATTANGRAVGTYDITISGNTAAKNYAVTVENGTLTVLDRKLENATDTMPTTPTKETVVIPAASLPANTNLSGLRLSVSYTVTTEDTTKLNNATAGDADFAYKQNLEISLIDIVTNLPVQPGGEITLFIPYPSSTDKNDTFTLMHILTGGGTQKITPTKLDNGLQFKVNSLSPFAIGWTKYVAPGGGGNGGGSGGSSTVATTYTITATAGVGGTMSTGEKVQVREGDSAGFTITPNKGYQILDVLINGKSIGATSSYVFTNVRSNQTIHATFKQVGHVNPQTGVDFDDVSENDWFYDAVMAATAKGWFMGTSETTFSPNSSTTRGMIATILYRMEGSPSASGAAFEDVADGTWYADAIAWAQANGIVTGYDNGNYGPSDNITREQLAAILFRYAKHKGYDVSKTAALNGFTDGETVSTYAKEAMSWAVGSGILSGRGNKTLAPRATATRAEVATLLTAFEELFTK